MYSAKKIRFSSEAATDHQVAAAFAMQHLILGIPCIYYRPNQPSPALNRVNALHSRFVCVLNAFLCLQISWPPNCVAPDNPRHAYIVDGGPTHGDMLLQACEQLNSQNRSGLGQDRLDHGCHSCAV